MKNLSNCKPSEFLAQTVRIKNLVKDWLDATKILEIRKTVPDIAVDADNEARKEAVSRQAMANLGNMIDAMFADNSEKTLSLLALVNFVEPECVDDYEMGDYLQSISELVSDERVISFFTSLIRLGQKNT